MILIFLYLLINDINIFIPAAVVVFVDIIKYEWKIIAPVALVLPHLSFLLISL